MEIRDTLVISFKIDTEGTMLIEPPHPFDVAHRKLRAKLVAISGCLVRQPYCSDEEMTLLAKKGP
jgi:hypothetical protein